MSIMLNNEEHNSYSVYMVAITVAVLLFLRDVIGISISKYIFIAIISSYAFLAKIDNVVGLLYFLLPVYVGLPGNILTVVFLTRLLFSVFSNNNELKCPTSAFALTVFMMLFMLWQNVQLDALKAYNMVCIAELLLILLASIFTRENTNQVIVFYSIGVATLGIVMLVATLMRIPFNALLSIASRLGDIEIEGASMFTSIDPNCYGVHAIAVVSCGWGILQRKSLQAHQQKTLIASMIISIFVSLIGLSRAFIVCLALWGVMSVFTTKGFKNKSLIISSTIVLVIIAIVSFPGVINTIIERFHADDMSTASGRTTIAALYADMWKENIFTLLFGIGLFVCEAHSVQLQLLFGVGILGTTFMAFLGLAYIKWFVKKPKLIDWVSVIFVQLAAATVPIARSLSYMIPVIISIYLLNNKKDNSVDSPTTYHTGCRYIK